MDISRILKHFPGVPDGASKRATPCTDGLINSTWLVGEGFVLQRVNPLFGARVNDDIMALTTSLRAASVPVPRLLPSSAGRPYVEDEGVWRVMTRLDGQTHHRVSDPKQAKSAAQLIARFHEALSGSTHSFAFTRPGAHDTPAHMAALRLALEAHQGHTLWSAVSPLADEIQRRFAGLAPASPLPRRIVHGDLKISNILFSASGDAVGLIDLDTMAWGDLEVELGDALRSWCSTTTEDAPNPELDVAIFQAAVEGYLGQAPDVSRDERLAIVRGLERITLELAARFAADALNECYFGWSAEVAATRGEHNLLRAANQLTLAREVANARPHLLDLVEGA